METPVARGHLPTQPPPLPALRLDHQGRRRVDYRALATLAAPLFLNSGIQAVLNLTDTWFLGRISTDATAAVGAVYWFVIVFLLVLGGVAIAVQTLAAQAFGAGDRPGAAQATWSGFWVVVLTTPLFLAAGMAGAWLLAPFGLAPGVEGLALEFWFPRMSGAVGGVALWALTSFFNGIGRTGVTLVLMLVVGLTNAALNQVLAFDLGLGVAGVAWATTAAQVVGVFLGLAVFLGTPVNASYHTRTTWRPVPRLMGQALVLGLPMGLLPAADLVGLALFQLMQVELGTVAGAATQIVMMLTSLAYMPAMGLASAGTTLVGQSIGAGDLDWARRVGNASIKVSVAFMGLVSLVLALGGPWLLPLFVTAADPNAGAVIVIGTRLIWIAAAYQVFDGLNLGAGFALRGAGDARLPALLVVVLSWCGFVPLAHMLTFAPGQGWVSGLPQFGFGATGGWAALLLYVAALGTVMGLRWRSGAWRRTAMR